MIVSISIIFIGIYLFSSITLITKGKDTQQRVTSAFISVFEDQIRSHTDKMASFLSQKLKGKKAEDIPGNIRLSMTLPKRGLDNIREEILDSHGSIIFSREESSFPTNAILQNKDEIEAEKTVLIAKKGGIAFYMNHLHKYPSRIVISLAAIPGTGLWYVVYYDLLPIEKLLLDVFKPLIEFRSFSLVLILISSIGFLLFILVFSYFTVRKTDRLEKNLLETNRELKSLSSLDGLTGLANRRRFDEYLSQELSKAVKNAKHFSLLIADVDFFKNYNDTYGHQMGDLCLRRVAGVFAETCRRPSDLPARYGGEEFTVVLPDTDDLGAFRVAEAIREEIVRLGIPHETSSALKSVSISIGVTTLPPGNVMTAEEIIQNADRALYMSKKEGRNRVTATHAGRQ